MTREKAIQMTYFLLRVVAGLLIFQPGSMKLLGWLGGVPPNGGTATPMTQPWIGGLLEVVGGVLIMLGLGTRVTAFILSGEMAVAYFQFHQPKGTWPAQNGGAPAVLLCFIFLYFAAAGAGPWSLDALIRKKKAGR
jgi:putative oxidoreductase